MSEKAQNVRLVLACVMTQALYTHSVCRVAEVYFGFTDRLYLTEHFCHSHDSANGFLKGKMLWVALYIPGPAQTLHSRQSETWKITPKCFTYSQEMWSWNSHELRVENHISRRDLSPDLNINQGVRLGKSCVFSFLVELPDISNPNFLKDIMGAVFMDIGPHQVS